MFLYFYFCSDCWQSWKVVVKLLPWATANRGLAVQLKRLFKCSWKLKSASTGRFKGNVACYGLYELQYLSSRFFWCSYANSIFFFFNLRDNLPKFIVLPDILAIYWVYSYLFVVSSSQKSHHRFTVYFEFEGYLSYVFTNFMKKKKVIFGKRVI